MYWRHSSVIQWPLWQAATRIPLSGGLIQNQLLWKRFTAVLQLCFYLWIKLYYFCGSWWFLNNISLRDRKFYIYIFFFFIHRSRKVLFTIWSMFIIHFRQLKRFQHYNTFAVIFWVRKLFVWIKVLVSNAIRFLVKICLNSPKVYQILLPFSTKKKNQINTRSSKEQQLKFHLRYRCHNFCSTACDSCIYSAASVCSNVTANKKQNQESSRTTKNLQLVEK